MTAFPGSLFLTCCIHMTSSAFTMANCSAWLFEHLSSSLNLSCSASTFPVNTATPDPTPCSLLLPSVKIFQKCSSSSSFVSTLTISAGWSQFLGFSALSIWYFWVILSIMLYCVATSWTFMCMGVIPVRIQSASRDIVRYALAILKLIILCTHTYLTLLHSLLINSIQTGAAYSSCGSIPPSYVVRQ